MKNQYILAVDLGGTFIKFGLFSVSGECVYQWKAETVLESSGDHILDQIAAETAQAFSYCGLNSALLKGIGIGVPGPVIDGRIVNKCVNLGWGVFDIRKDLQKRMGAYGFSDLYIQALNDANAAALGEYYDGAGRDYMDVALVTIGTGIGCGIILQGKLREGAFGGAGEIGHFLMNPVETEFCGCGKRGCLEQYAAARGIVRRAQQQMKLSDTPSILRHIPEPTAKDILDAAKEDDPFGLDAARFAGDMIGRALAFISGVVDPEAFLLGGGISEAGEVILEPTRESFRKYAFHTSRDAVIRCAELRNDAGIYGAYRAVRNIVGQEVSGRARQR
jgi:glucokinase